MVDVGVEGALAWAEWRGVVDAGVADTEEEELADMEGEGDGSVNPDS